MKMEGVELIKDQQGKIQEIRVKAKDNPDLAGEIYRLINILMRNQDQDDKAIEEKEKATGKKPMSLTAFRKLISLSRKSGEISEEEFFQQHPSWKKEEKLSLPS